VRFLRSATVGVITLAIAAGMAPNPAVASVPAPPYNAFVIDGGRGSWLLAGVLAFDATNSTISASEYGTNGFSVSVSNAEHFWHLVFAPPSGSTITIGTTYQTLRFGPDAVMDVGGDGRGCNYQSGFMTVKELTLAPGTTRPTTLAATFSVGCESDVQAFFGEIRLNSSMSVAATTISSRSINFGDQPIGTPATEATVTVTAVGPADSVFGAARILDSTMFTVTTDTCSNSTLAQGATCTIGVRAKATAVGEQIGWLELPVNSLSGIVFAGLRVNGVRNNVGTYYPLAPSRILDTRVGNGASGAVGPGGSIHLQVTGRGGVPTSGVSAVVLNVTVTGPTTSGHITVWPTGAGMPTASSLNFVAGWTGANSVTTAVGTNGRVDLFNSAGNTHLIADVVGYYTPDNSLVPIQGFGGEFQPKMPQRLFDSRVDWGFKLPADFFVELPFSYGTTLDPHIRALAVNITAVDGEGFGYLTAWNGQSQLPLASTLNFSQVGAVPNFAIVPTGTCFDCTDRPVPMIGIYTSVDVHLIVDVIGFYDDGQLADGENDGLRFTPRTPLRITDSRIGQGIAGALGTRATASVAPPASSLPPATEAVALNVTAVAPTATTYISVWPNGLPQPLISTLNPNAGQVVPNAAPVLLGDGTMFNVYNNVGSVHLVIDMVGTFYFLPALAGSSSSLGLKVDGQLPEYRGYASGPGTRFKAQLNQR
jgi:hypothetical protein